MSPDKQQIAIAEACGIVSHDRWGPLYKTDEGFVRACPDYLTDLNAMHEAEKVLSEEQFYNYYRTLITVWSRQADFVKDIHPIRATSVQRAEAFLRTIGKWEDGK